MKKLVLAILIVAILVPTTVVFAAPVPCKYYWTVRATDTLGSISKATKISPWDIRQANKAMMTQPNYPILLGGKLCIPYTSTSTKVLPSWILNQSPWQVIARNRLNRYLDVFFSNGSPGQNFWVKVNNVKIGKILVTKKTTLLFTFRLPANARTVCFKNMLTDFAFCVPIYYPR